MSEIRQSPLKLRFISVLLLMMAAQAVLAEVCGCYRTSGMDFGFRYELVPFKPRNLYRTEPAKQADAPSEPIEDAPIRTHPRWVRLEQAILKALLPFVEARDAVARSKIIVVGASARRSAELVRRAKRIASQLVHAGAMSRIVFRWRFRTDRESWGCRRMRPPCAGFRRFR